MFDSSNTRVRIGVRMAPVMKAMKTALFLIATLSVFAQPKKQNPALEGLDPVLRTEGQEVPGLASINRKHGRFLYLFSSGETLDRFKKDPDRYAIQLEGACARMGPPVTGSG